MATAIQHGFRSPVDQLETDRSLKGIPQTTSETNIKEKKSLGKKLKDWLKKPFTKPKTATDIPLDQRTDISSSQNLDAVKQITPPKPEKFNPYQHPAHGQIFIPGSIAVVRNGNETLAYVPGNIAVAINKPGINLDSMPILLAQNTVAETDPVEEQTPKLEGEMSPQFEVLSPKFNPVEVAAQINNVEHMNEKEAAMYAHMREPRMLYASNTTQMNPAMYVHPTQMKKSMAKLNENGRDSMRESRQYA